jgi:hypothetical protein
VRELQDAAFVALPAVRARRDGDGVVPVHDAVSSIDASPVIVNT